MFYPNLVIILRTLGVGHDSGPSALLVTQDWSLKYGASVKRSESITSTPAPQPSLAEKVSGHINYHSLDTSIGKWKTQFID